MIKFQPNHTLPESFNAAVYKLLNRDLEHLTDSEAGEHYLNYGWREKRKYLRLHPALPHDFDPVVYKSLHSDLLTLSGDDVQMHYLYFGNRENRKYKAEPQSEPIQIEPVLPSPPSSEKAFQVYCKYLVRFLTDKIPRINRNSKNKSVLVETREFIHTEFTIKNTIQKLGAGWGHMVFCGHQNVVQIAQICAGISPEIEIIQLEKEINTVDDYNNLLLKTGFWEMIRAEKVLIYQTDTFIFKPFDTAFLQFDYVGGPWKGEHLEYLSKQVQSTTLLQVGNGGLSIRSVAVAKEILNRHDPLKNPVDYPSTSLPEDVYFSKYVTEDGYNVADLATANQFSFETELVSNTFGCHKPWRFFKSAKEMQHFLLHGFLKKGKQKRVLFINHQESLTGAPKLLKEIIAQYGQYGHAETFIFSQSVSDDAWPDENTIRPNEIEGTSDKEISKNLANLLEPDLIFANTIEAMHLARHFSCAKIIYIHEFRSLIPFGKNLSLLKDFDKVYVVNDGAREILNTYGVQSEICTYGFYNPMLSSFSHDVTPDVIVGIGYVQYRKGVDRFIRLAEKLPNEKFIWLGSTEGVIIESGYITLEGWNFQTTRYCNGDRITPESLKIKIPPNVSFKGLTTGHEIYNNWLPRAKALLMLSYDDPFPLVVIEAKAVNKNVVTLKEAGDSYKICDHGDLILDEYDEDAIINYLQGLIPNTNGINITLLNWFAKNNTEIHEVINRFLSKEVSSVKLNEKLKVFTSIHSDSSPECYDLLSKTTRSLSQFKNLEIKILVNENNKRLTEIAGDNAEVMIIKHRMNDQLIQNYSSYKAVTATYNRTEIPLICQQRGYEDNCVMYCDFDILCLKNPAVYLDTKPNFFQAAPEFYQNNFHSVNTGVLFLNVKNMFGVDSDFLNFMRRNLGEFEVHDQSAYNLFFKNKIEQLNPLLNWKPYWGVSYQSAIVHFHWLKPYTKLQDAALQQIITRNFKPDDLNLKAVEFYQQLWNNF